MTLSLVLTMSRSGMSALLLAVSVTCIFALRRQDSRGSRMVKVAFLTLLLLVVGAWVGADAIMARFTQTDWSQFNGRRGAWADAWNIATRFPLTGTGLNTYGVATLFFQQHDLSFHYVQAHNDYLQLAAEGGLLLAVPAVIILGVFVAIVRRRFIEETSTTTYWLRVGAVTGLAAIALQETVEFSLQMPGDATLFAVLCAIALHRTPEHRMRARAPTQ
jgi:O-antigen ligase